MEKTMEEEKRAMGGRSGAVSTNQNGIPPAKSGDRGQEGPPWNGRDHSGNNSRNRNEENDADYVDPKVADPRGILEMIHASDLRGLNGARGRRKITYQQWQIAKAYLERTA